jgi:hypothetical protein
VKLQFAITIITLELHDSDEISRKLFAKVQNWTAIPVPRVNTEPFTSELLEILQNSISTRESIPVAPKQKPTVKERQVHCEPVLLTKTAEPSSPLHAVEFGFEQFRIRGISLCTEPQLPVCNGGAQARTERKEADELPRSLY